MKIGKTLLIIFIILAGFIPAILTITLISNVLFTPRSVPSQSSHYENAVIATQNAISVNSYKDKFLTDTEIVMELDETLYALYGDNYYLDFSFSGDRKVLTISIAGECSEAAAAAAISGQQHHLDNWNKILVAAKEASKSWSETFKANGHDVMVFVNYTNPDNYEEYFISAANGVTVYDAVSGIDLISQLLGE